MTTFFFSAAAAACAMIGFAGSALSAELVTNGGFEAGDFSGWTQGGNTASTVVTPLAPHSGSFNASLGPFATAGTLSQDLNTVAGQQYMISFWLRNSFGDVGNHFTAVFGGNQLFNLSDSPTFAYAPFSFVATANASLSTLLLDFRNDTSFWYLDDVSAVALTPAVPEPASWAMMISGFGLVGFAMRRRATSGVPQRI
jgi:hypothetical protein